MSDETREVVEADGDVVALEMTYSKLCGVLHGFDHGPQETIPDTSTVDLPDPITWGDMRLLKDMLADRLAQEHQEKTDE